MKKRIIPCLDVRDGKVVKGKQFQEIQNVADPLEMAEIYNAAGADELVYYDIMASMENRGIFTDIIKSIKEKISIPLTVGGGVNTVEDFKAMVEAGADKVSINSGAIKNPQIIYDVAKEFGSSRVVFAMDVKKVGEAYHVFSKGGSVDTGIDALDWAAKASENGAGEIVVNSIDTDGVKKGFDLDLLKAVASRVSVPLVASGGAGTMEDFLQVFREIPQVESGLAASVFHFGEIEIPKLKTYLAQNGVSVNI